MARTDGSTDEFTDPALAEAAQADSPGSQLRRQTRHRDVPADYAVIVDDEVVDRFMSAQDAGRLARQTGGAVVIMPIDE